MAMCALYEGCALPAWAGSIGGQLASDAEHRPTPTGSFPDSCDPSEPNWAGQPLYRYAKISLCCMADR